MLGQVSTALSAPGAQLFAMLGFTPHEGQIIALYLMIGFAGWALIRSMTASRKSHWGQVFMAEVIGIVCDGDQPDYPRIAFTDGNGQRLSRLTDSPCTYETSRIGNKIPVMYDPASRRCEVYYDDTPLQQRRHLFSFLLFACLVSFSLGVSLPAQMMA